ncbi:MAG: glucose 1-dehydrogenase [Mycetocola sp.]
MSDSSLSGQVALVTAAGRGIGRAIAVDLARAGADVVVGLRRVDGRADVVSEIESLGRRALPLVLDVRDLESCRAALDSLEPAWDRIDILVNNAGGSIVGNALSVTEDDFADVWELNVRSTFFLSQHIARRYFVPQRAGAIVNVASQAGIVALPGESAYCISKAAVIHLTKCLAVEWGDLGVRVNAVAPTFIRTDGTESALADEEFLTDTLERIAALHRIGTPEEVAAAVTFLASPAASLITGHTLAVDGGWTVR